MQLDGKISTQLYVCVYAWCALMYIHATLYNLHAICCAYAHTHTHTPDVSRVIVNTSLSLYAFRYNKVL